MGPDPFNMPSFGGAQNYSGMLQQQVSQLAPLATTWSGPAHGVSPGQVFNPVAPPKTGGFLSFLGGVASQIGHIAGGATSWLAKNTVQAVEAPAKFSYDFTTGAIRTYEERNQENALDGRQQNLVDMFKSGKISAKDYQDGMKDILKGRASLTQDINLTNKRLANSKTEGIDTAATLVTIATAGIGTVAAEPGEQLAAQYLKSAGVDNFMSEAETTIGKLASNPTVFAKLEPAAQQALQKATAEVVANSTATSTAAQIARNTAINVALKYPIYYNYLSTTGNQIYNDLDNKKYGDAVRTMAFNAALLLSGGPIGYALKYGGKALEGVGMRTFGQTSFWDELSQFYGDASEDGFAITISRMAEDMAPSEKDQFIRNLSAMEATNVSATAGDAGAAAYRVAKGMQSMYGDGINLSNISHEDGVSDMLNYAEAFRMADDEAQRVGLPGIAIGRVDARQLSVISQALSPAMAAEDKSAAEQAWESLKAANTNQAWANNANFDKQIKGLISRSSTPEELNRAISNISASFDVEKFAPKVANKLAKMGYIPIKPVNLEAPFEEGSGKLLSKYGEGDFFTKAVQPLPILESLGGAMTSLGISPNASNQKVYELFNDNLAKNLNAGTNEETDTMIKQLSNYAHNPTRGSIMSHLPITDLRMMTTSDIKVALKTSSRNALEVQKAIADSYMQVPLAIRGLGDRAVDISYKGPVGAVMRRYLRIQGAVRFAWNPFFQYLRVIPKTEILTTAEGGGYISSIFNGKLGELESTRNALREIGAFEKTPGGLGNVVSGEATDFGGSTAGNLSKKLLPQQERSISGLVTAQADRMKMDTTAYINTFPQNVRDTVQMIAQYDRRSNFLNSPMARTLNIAVFPFRFDSKVLGILTRSLARTAPLTQVSVINGIFRASDWLNSQEGIQWYSKNSDAIGLFKYITPIASFAEIFTSLMPGHDHSLGNFGELGGLPFGWIPQILDAEGLTQFNQPGVAPKTGETYTKYIPTTMRGQVATALQDFISSIFSYPGATVGLPSKTKITQGIAFPFVGATKTGDFQATTPQISSEQQNFADAVQKANPPSPGSAMPGYAAQQLPKNQQPTPNPSSGPLNSQQQVPRLPAQVDTMPGKQSSASKGKKKTKAEQTPYLLPGQTVLGQTP